MKYDLVFEGGGAKGMVFVGAYAEFRARGFEIGRLLGTSAGAITATLLAVGYTPEEMLAALSERENGKSVFAGFMGAPRPFTDAEVKNSAIRTLLRNVNLKFIPDFLEERLDDTLAGFLAENEKGRHLFALVERGGWFAADRFVTWLQAKLDTGPWKDGQRAFSQATLAQLYEATQIELAMVASDVTDSRLLVLNHRTAPALPVVWAVRMSMSIPLVWDEVIWKEDWGTYQGRTMKDHAIVDGGLLSNFPIELFISDAPEVVRLMGPKSQNPVLGMLIDESLPVEPVPRARGWLVDVNVKPTELRLVQRLQRLADTATTAHDKMVIEEYEPLVLRLPAKGYGTTEFDMSDEKRAALVEAGRRAMRAYQPPTRAPRAVPRGPGEPGTPAVSPADRVARRLLGA